MLYTVFLCFCVFMNPEMEKSDRESKLNVNHFIFTAYFDICLDEAIALSRNKKEHFPDISISLSLLFFSAGCLYCCFWLVVDINK